MPAPLLLAAALLPSASVAAAPTARSVHTLADSSANIRVDSLVTVGPRLEVMRTWKLAYPDFIEPVALACGPLGQLYIADLGRGTVLRLDDNANIDFAFETPAGQPDLQPLDLAATGFKVYVLDAVSNALLRFTEDGAFLDVLHSFRTASVETPRALAVDGSGRVLLVNEARHSAQILDAAQGIETTVGGFGSRAGELSRPSGAVFAQEGSFYVADTGNARVLAFSGVGNLLHSWYASDAPLREPRGLALGRRGELLVADPAGRAVHLLGAVPGRLPLAELHPLDVAVSGDAIWVLSDDPAVLVRARIVREE